MVLLFLSYTLFCINQYNSPASKLIITHKFIKQQDYNYYLKITIIKKFVPLFINLSNCLCFRKLKHLKVNN